MKIIPSLSLLFFFLIMVYHIAGDNYEDEGKVSKSACVDLIEKSVTNKDYPILDGALLASRINSLEELKSLIQLDYYNSGATNAKVELRHCSDGKEAKSVLKSGINQQEIMKVRSSGLWGKAWFLTKSPFAVINRKNLIKVYNLARRKPLTFGEGDVAFYDLAETSVKNINTQELAFLHPKDKGEKGFINSFNHITAQALITSCFSEEMADFVSDVHERKNMPELTTGKFTQEQLMDPNQNHVDNYVDMINNEWGQAIGQSLKQKYKIDQETYWTAELLANYLNDLQSYYSWAYKIGFKPYSIKDEVVIRYAKKINVVMQGSIPL